MTLPADAIQNAVLAVTKDWAKQRKAEERNRNAIFNRRSRLVRSDRVTIREAAFEFMEKAYLAASDNGRLPAKARQIMYAARPHILMATGKESIDDGYFTQQLLPDFIDAHPETCAAWDVVWDA